MHILCVCVCVCVYVYVSVYVYVHVYVYEYVYVYVYTYARVYVGKHLRRAATCVRARPCVSLASARVLDGYRTAGKSLDPKS